MIKQMASGIIGLSSMPAQLHAVVGCKREAASVVGQGVARHVNVLMDPHASPIIVGRVLVRHSIRRDAKRTFAQVTKIHDC